MSAQGFAVQVCPSAERTRSGAPGVRTLSSFSFGGHYDPGNTHLGALVAHNQHDLRAGHGFAMHAHRDLEIVTWVLAGRLRHEDDAGRTAEVGPGTVQWLRAGSGVRHREVALGRTRLVQAWLTPDVEGGSPDHAVREATGALAGGNLVAVASGRGHEGAVLLGRREAVLWVGRLRGAVPLPVAPLEHVFVAAGRVLLETGTSRVLLRAGDAARLHGAGGRLVPRPSRARRVAPESDGVDQVHLPAAEVLVWQLGEAP